MTFTWALRAQSMLAAAGKIEGRQSLSGERVCFERKLLSSERTNKSMMITKKRSNKGKGFIKIGAAALTTHSPPLPRLQLNRLQWQEPQNIY